MQWQQVQGGGSVHVALAAVNCSARLAARLSYCLERRILIEFGPCCFTPACSDEEMAAELEEIRGMWEMASILDFFELFK